MDPISIIALLALFGAAGVSIHRSNASDEREYPEEELPDVTEVDYVLPEEFEPPIHYEPLELRQPEDPLWANYRLCEGPLEPLPKPMPSYLLTPRPPLQGANMPFAQSPLHPLWQNDRSIAEIMASMNSTNMPSAPGNVTMRRSEETRETGELEDPFAEDPTKGWSYDDGHRHHR